ncbi:hypothetical protein HDU78_007935 [Chytriomyces hyalinus]|nr:hypothetical protein HDU78_007935 [Chytriomyces hyalinus]
MKSSLLLAVSAQALVGLVAAVPVWTYFEESTCQSAVVRAKTRPDTGSCQPMQCAELLNQDGSSSGKYVNQVCTSDPVAVARAAFSPGAEVVEEYQHTDASCNDVSQDFVMTVPNVCFAAEGGSGSFFRFSTNSGSAVLDQYSDASCQTNLNVPIPQQFNVCYDRSTSAMGGTGYRFVGRFIATAAPSPTTSTTTTTTTTTTATTSTTTTTTATTTTSTTTTESTTTSTTTTESTTTSTTTTEPTSAPATTTTTTTTSSTTASTSAAPAYTLAAILEGVAVPKAEYGPRLADGCISKFQLSANTGLPEFINDPNKCGDQANMLAQFGNLFDIGFGIAKLNNGFLANGTYVIQVQTLNSTQRRDTLDSGRGNWNWLYNGVNPIPVPPKTEEPPQPPKTEEPPRPVDPPKTEEPPRPVDPPRTEEPPRPQDPPRTEAPPSRPEPTQGPAPVSVIVRPDNIYTGGALQAVAGAAAGLLAVAALVL